MRVGNNVETGQASGSQGWQVGDIFLDPQSGETFTDLGAHYPGLYVQIGGHWAPTGTEPFIGPVHLGRDPNL